MCQSLAWDGSDYSRREMRDHKIKVKFVTTIHIYGSEEEAGEERAQPSVS